LLLMVNGTDFLEKKVEQFDNAMEINLTGFEKTTTERGMLKFKNEVALVYIKAPVKFFQGSHDPRYCWQGSGYEFSDIQLKRIGDLECYTAILRKGTDLLYTAWWYQNGTQQTVYEDWRWDSLKGKGGFSLVNVSCESRSDLEKWVEVDILGL
ncbi:MAG: exosortase N, partial [Nonlabens sp.]